MSHAFGRMQARAFPDSIQTRSAAPRRKTAESRSAEGEKIRWPVFLFLLALVVPWVIYIGPLRTSLYRMVLLVMVLPCLGMWMVGKAGRRRIADFALILYCFWGSYGLLEIHGVALSIQPSGIMFVETLGAYFLARCYIRDANDFYNAVQLLFWIVAFLLPFAIVECLTGHNILRGLFEAIYPTLPYNPMQRSGLTRVQSVFDHPILFGVCTGSIISIVHLVLGYQRNSFQRALRTGIVVGTSLLSLSAGPLASVVCQGFLLSWNRLLAAVRFRWLILIGLSALFVLAIELLANRSPIEIIVTYFLFDSDSYWIRKMIWDYGSAAALSHPLLGVGLNAWIPIGGTLPPSIDNFWLVQAVNHGLPAAFLMLLNFFSIFLTIAFKKGLSNKLVEYRTGLLITMTAFFLVGWTVAFWDTAYVFYLFVIGSGVWIADVETKKTPSLIRKGSSSAVVRTSYGLRRRVL
jgi:hypothetical protein